MAYCRNCGTQIHDQAAVCPTCGVPQIPANGVAANDTGSFGWAALGCCVPVAGLVLWLLWKDTQPRNARQAGLGALISTIASAILLVILVVIYIVLIGVLIAYS